MVTSIEDKQPEVRAEVVKVYYLRSHTVGELSYGSGRQEQMQKLLLIGDLQSASG